MPRSPASDAGHGVFTDHSIRRAAPSSSPGRDPSSASWTLRGFTPADTGVRELGLAYAEIGVRTGDRRQQAEAIRLLTSAPQDAELQVRLGDLQERAGNPGRAAELYQAALRQNPNLVVALVNLGRLYGSNGLLDVRHEGAQLYAITEIISGFTGFSDWLNQEAPEVMRAPATNTVDHLIAQFGDPKPPAPPIVQNKRDYVAEIFAPPLLATDIRGQRTEAAHGRESYSPPVDPRPGPYTMVVDPGKKTTGSHPVAPPVPPTKPPAPDAAAATQLTRIAVLESQVGMWKMAAIAACVLAGLCLLVTFILVMRSK